MASDSTVIRAATADDAAAAGELLAWAWRNSYGSLFPSEFWADDDAARRAAVVRDRFRADDPSVRAAVAHSACGETIGWAMAGRSRELDGVPRVRAVEFFQLYVTRPGHGLGERLLNAVLPPGTEAQLWVFTANESAQRFYRRHGFAPDGARNRYRKDLAGGIEELRFVR